MCKCEFFFFTYLAKYVKYVKFDKMCEKFKNSYVNFWKICEIC